MSEETGQILVWEDVETTGLDENNDALLEVAVVVTDANLNVLDEDGFEATVWYSPGHAHQLRSATVPFVQDMHDTTGLWDRLPGGTPVEKVDADLAQYLAQYAPDQSQLRPGDRTLRLAGNSVKLDFAFTRVNLPMTFAQLNYRVLDVSSLAFVAGQWWECGEFPKQRQHSAMADIRESLDEARWLREKMGAPRR